MGVRITDENMVALYDSTTGEAFGPLFGSHAAAENFLEWLEEQYQTGKTFQFGDETVHFADDPRVYEEAELQHVHHLWHQTFEQENK